MKVKVPTKPADITLEMAQKIMLIDNNNEIEPFAKKVHTVAIVTGLSATEAAAISIFDLDRIYNATEALIGSIDSTRMQTRVKYLGREYGFIEDVRDMETGAFVDIDEMSRPETYAENLHKIMAILYRPIDAEIGGRYRLQSYVKEDPRERAERQAIFLKHMTMDVVQSAAAFFLRIMQGSYDITKNLYLRPDQLKAAKQMFGVGSISSMRSPEETS
jgi:hypothetical protein